MNDLSIEMLRQLFDADFDTGALFWKARDLALFKNERAGKIWNTKWAGKKVATSDNGDGYATVRVFNKLRRMHRVMFALLYDYYPEAVDHINGDRSDNRGVNLRDATAQINSRNRRLTRSTSGAVGVAWRKNRQRWEAYIYIDRRRKVLGTFTDYAAAAEISRSAREIAGFHPNHGRPL